MPEDLGTNADSEDLLDTTAGITPASPPGYELCEEIGRGGMGVVYRARDVALDRYVALKLLSKRYPADALPAQRFLSEARITGQLQHPGIPAVHQVGTRADGRPFLAMRLIKGSTLEAILKRRTDPAADRGRLLAILEAVCQAVGYAHAHRVIHRDLKPANVMVGAFGEVQVMDWGLAKVLGEEMPATEAALAAEQTHAWTEVSPTPETGSHTQAGSLVGTPAFIAPEQALGEIEKVNERADVFGLGALLAVILTGQPPYVGESYESVRVLAIRGKLDDCFARLDASGAEPELVALCKQCLAFEPADRPADAGAVAQAIAGLRAAADERARRAELERVRVEGEQATAQAQAAERRKRRRLVIGAAAVLAVATVAGLSAVLAVQRQANADLAAKNQELAQAGQSERDARQAESSQRQRAETEKKRADILLADMYTARGLLAADRDAAAEAVLWFAAAADQSATGEDLRRQEDNRLRARNWMRQAALPVAAMSSSGGVRQLDFQPRGDLLLVRFGKGEVIFWSWRGGKRLSWAEKLTGVGSVQFSPDGTSVALGFRSGEAQIRKVSDGVLLAKIQHEGQIRVLSFSPDGKFLAVASNIVRVWDIKEQTFLDAVWSHPQEVVALMFNRKGDRLITTCLDKRARVFAVENRQERKEPLYAPVIHAVPSSPALIDQDRILVTVSGGSELRRWDMATGKPASTPIRTKPYNLQGVVSSLDGNWFAAAGNYGPELYPAGATQPPVYLGHTNMVTMFAFSPDNTMLLSASWDQTARLWSLPHGQPLGQPLNHMAIVDVCAWSHDVKHLATAQIDGLIRVWQRPVDDPVIARKAGWGQRPRVSFDGRLVAPGLWHEASFDRSSILGVHQNVNCLRVVTTANAQPAGPDISLPGTLVDSCVCGDNLGVAAVWSRDAKGQLGVWDVATARARFKPISLPGIPISVAARPESGALAVICLTGDLLVIDDKTGESVLKVRHEGWAASPPSRPIQVQYTPDGRTLVSLCPGDTSTVNVRDADTGQLRFAPLRPSWSGSRFHSFALSPDSRLLATMALAKNAAQVWDLATGRALSEPLPHPGDSWGLFSVRFSPDGQYLLTCHKDGQVRYWDWRAGKLACPPMVHADETFDVAITPDGHFALSAVRGRPDMHIWELATGRRIAPPVRLGFIEGESSHVLAMTPDARRVLVNFTGSTTRPAMDLAVVDLAALLSPPSVPTADLALLAELATARRIELGDLSGMTTDHWLERWNLLRDRNPDLARSFDIGPNSAKK